MKNKKIMKVARTMHSGNRRVVLPTGGWKELVLNMVFHGSPPVGLPLREAFFYPG